MYEKYRSADITRDDFLQKKQLLSEEKDKLQIELSAVEANIEQAINDEKKENANLQTMKDIVSLSTADDEELQVRMYDDIDKVIVLDNKTLNIVWKFDVDFGDSYP